MDNFKFEASSETVINSLFTKREGETKLGERVSWEMLPMTRFVLLGIQEDIGPQTNLGNEGSKNAFIPAIKKFLNMQSNRFLDGNEVYFLGTISQNCNFKSIEDGEKLVLELDELISNLLVPVFKQGMTPIIIGGGHNNAYPILKSQFTATTQKLEVVNLDPHADCRALEGRHSGNPFSYATLNGYLEHYSVLGLHKGYNNAAIYSFLDEHQYFYRFFEDYLDNAALFEKDIDTVCQPTAIKLGIELDLDAIKNMPSSAFTPSGFTIEEARIFIRKLAQSNRKIAYLHIPEGAPIGKKEELLVGKTISYLIYDFITSELSK